jgi:surface carbohydrate biosynthesis protein (TIGR04326 family)
MSTRPPWGAKPELMAKGKGDVEFSPIAFPILGEVEKQAESLRSRYLAWVYDLGECCIEGRRLTDHLQLRAGFSYWWMTPFVEKCNFQKSPWIDVAIKLMAYTGGAVTHSMEALRLLTANRSLAVCLRQWCAASGVGFEWRAETESAPKESIRRGIYHALPTGLQAAFWLIRHVVERWPLRGVGVSEWRVSSARICFVSYLFNLVPAAKAEQRFESRYWGHLPEVLRDEGCATNWLHIFVKDNLVPTTREAARVLRGFNQSAQGRQVHVALDSFLSARVVLKTLRDWLRIARSSRRLEKYVAQTSSNGLNFWPLFADEWRDSMAGTAAMGNMLYLNLFEAALKSIPPQQTGVYLQENQGWEFALLQTWKAAGHGRIIGCAHSSVRYWDLRYFFDTRCFNRMQANPMPMPDKIAVNGAGGLKSFCDGGYPAANLVEVEALRYLYLNELHGGSNVEPAASRSDLRLLVLGDYTIRHTRVQMHLLEQAAAWLPAGTTIIIKPHPDRPIRAADYPKLSMRVTMEPIATLLPHCDVVYTSAATSAALDAFCAGVPVISVLDSDTLNQSPLRGMDGVQFVSTPTELSQAIVRAAKQSRDLERGRGFFHLDTDLPRWKKLLLEPNHV